LTGVMAAHGADITSVDIVEARQTYLELEASESPAILEELAKRPIVQPVEQARLFRSFSANDSPWPRPIWQSLIRRSRRDDWRLKNRAF
jgi:hypothetical protein